MTLKIFISFRINNNLNFQIGYLQFYSQTFACIDVVYAYKKIRNNQFSGHSGKIF